MDETKTPEPAYRCSYCKSRATHFGEGQDADFYCPRHVHKAPGPTSQA